MNLTQKPGVKVRISVEIEAQSPSGFDDGIQRAFRENCEQLKVWNVEFQRISRGWIEGNFEKLTKYFDKWSAYDNQGAKWAPPKLIKRGKK